MEVFKIWRLELWEVTYNSFLRNFHNAREIVRVKEMFELWDPVPGFLERNQEDFT